MDLEMDPQFHAAKAAAKNGNVVAQLGLGFAFLNAEDPRRALYWFTRAASEPHYNLEAMEELATLYEYGSKNDGSIQNIEKACSWMGAMLQKMDDEQAKVPWMVKYGGYLIGLCRTLALGKKKLMLSKDKQDPVKGVALLEKAAELGNVKAMKWLGDVYHSSRSPIETNITKAMKYYQMGAEHGNGACACQMALAYTIGVVPVDVEKAKYWKDQAIALGHSEASIVKPFPLLNEEDAGELLNFLNGDEHVNKLTGLDDEAKCCNPECKNVENRLQGNRFMVCSRCRSVKYCSKACQKVHWKEHKKECKTMLDSRKEIIQSSRTMVENLTKKD